MNWDQSFFVNKEMEAQAMADETTQQQGDQTSAGDSGTTSEEPPTLTATQAKAMAEKARSDALAEVGRLKKAFEENERIAQDVLRRLQVKEEAELRREEEAVMDDPDKLSAIRERRAAGRRAAEVDAREQKVKAREAELQAQSQEVLTIRAERLAEKYNIDQTVLLKYGGSTKESMEDLAKTYGERKTTSGDTRTRVTSPPDSGKTMGGGSKRMPTLDELKASSPAETERKVKSGEWVIPGWK